MNRLIALLRGKCPKCHHGNMFAKPWYNILQFWNMNKTCPSCNLTFAIEPGFFFGAMYLSYGFVVGIMLVGGYIIYNYFGDPDTIYYILPITLVSILMTPFNFRMARILYMYLFSGIKYSKI